MTEERLRAIELLLDTGAPLVARSLVRELTEEIRRLRGQVGRGATFAEMQRDRDEERAAMLRPMPSDDRGVSEWCDDTVAGTLPKGDRHVTPKS